MVVLVNSGELELAEALGDNGFSLPLNCDAMLITKRGYIPVERKHFPGDFLASVTDGRLASQCSEMRQISPFPIIIKEGHGQFDIQGNLILNRKPSRWTRKGINNLRRSLEYMERCFIEETEGVKDTADRLLELQEYFDNPKHISLRARPPLDTEWLVPSSTEKYMYWLQGFPGIKVSRAKTISDKYPNPTDFLSDIYGVRLGEPNGEKLKEINRFGDKLVNGIVELLRGHIDKII